MACEFVTDGVSRNIIVTFCGTSLGLVRSVNGTSGVQLADITSIEDTRQNNVATLDIATATIEIFGYEEAIPEPGARGTLSITGSGITYSEYMILESVDISASVGEAVIYTANFNTAVDMGS